MHLSVASRSLPPYIALTVSSISRGGVKINVSCYVINLIFDLDRLLQNGSRATDLTALSPWQIIFRWICSVAATKPDSNTTKRKMVAHDFKLSTDGRLIITDDSLQQGHCFIDRRSRVSLYFLTSTLCRGFSINIKDASQVQ